MSLDNLLEALANPSDDDLEKVRERIDLLDGQLKSLRALEDLILTRLSNASDEAAAANGRMPKIGAARRAFERDEAGEEEDEENEEEAPPVVKPVAIRPVAPRLEPKPAVPANMATERLVGREGPAIRDRVAEQLRKQPGRKVSLADLSALLSRSVSKLKLALTHTWFVLSDDGFVSLSGDGKQKFVGAA